MGVLLLMSELISFTFMASLICQRGRAIYDADDQLIENTMWRKKHFPTLATATKFAALPDRIPNLWAFHRKLSLAQTLMVRYTVLRY